LRLIVTYLPILIRHGMVTTLCFIQHHATKTQDEAEVYGHTFSTLQLKRGNDQLHAPDLLHSVPTEWDLGWPYKPVWTLRRYSSLHPWRFKSSGVLKAPNNSKPQKLYPNGTANVPHMNLHQHRKALTLTGI